MNWKRIIIGKWSWKRPLYTIFWCYLLLALTACFFADSLIFQPPGTPYPKERSHFSSLGEGEKAVAIYMRQAPAGRPTILWSHGNAQNLKSLYRTLDNLHRQGFGVVSYDYPGYGESGGKPSEKGCYRAAEATYQHLTETLKIPASDIIIAGQSVGSGPSCWLASKKDHRGLVLISPFLSTFRVVTRIPLFFGDRFPNLRHITKIDSPLLIVHGEQDQVIPFQDGQKLFQLSPSKQKTFVPVAQAGHNDLFAQSDFDLFATLQDFVQKN